MKEAETDEAIDAAAATAGEKVQAAIDAIAAAVDVDDTSEYTATVEGIESSLETNTDSALSAYQTARIEAAIKKADSAVDEVDLDATDEEIEAAETAVKAAEDAIAAADNVDDTSMYSAQVGALASSLKTAKGLVMDDRAAKSADRAADQKTKINSAITAATEAVALVVDGASDEVITAANDAVAAARTAIEDADDVDDTSAYSATVDGIENNLNTQTQSVMVSRAQQNPSWHFFRPVEPDRADFASLNH